MDLRECLDIIADKFDTLFIELGGHLEPTRIYPTEEDVKRWLVNRGLASAEQLKSPASVCKVLTDVVNQHLIVEEQSRKRKRAELGLEKEETPTYTAPPPARKVKISSMDDLNTLKTICSKPVGDWTRDQVEFAYSIGEQLGLPNNLSPNELCSRIVPYLPIQALLTRQPPISHPPTPKLPSTKLPSPKRIPTLPPPRKATTPTTKGQITTLSITRPDIPCSNPIPNAECKPAQYYEKPSFVWLGFNASVINSANSNVDSIIQSLPQDLRSEIVWNCPCLNLLFRLGGGTDPNAGLDIVRQVNFSKSSGINLGDLLRSVWDFYFGTFNEAELTCIVTKLGENYEKNLDLKNQFPTKNDFIYFSLNATPENISQYIYGAGDPEGFIDRLYLGEIKRIGILPTGTNVGQQVSSTIYLDGFTFGEDKGVNYIMPVLRTQEQRQVNAYPFLQYSIQNFPTC